jgi:hypothetical protein
LSTLGAVARHQQVCRHALADLGQNAHAIHHALHGPEIGEVQQQLLARRSIMGRAGLGVVRLVSIAVDEVLDHANLVGDAEHVDGLLAQVVADRRDPVGLLYRELGDRVIRPVHAHQGDIRAMQRGDERQPAPGREHLLRQHGGNGMRNGIVYVQHVQTVGFAHFRHARRQRQAIRRILEQRVGGDFHFVIVNPRRARIQPDGIGVADEMHLVSAGS